jgi:hypothetical protein
VLGKDHVVDASTIRCFNVRLEVRRLMASAPNSYGWGNADLAMCIRCDEAPGVDEEGLHQLRERLRKEVSFQEWLARHPEAA